MTRKEYKERYKKEKIALCSGCGHGPRCFLSHFDSTLTPKVMPTKIECGLRKPRAG